MPVSNVLAQESVLLRPGIDAADQPGGSLPAYDDGFANTVAPPQGSRTRGNTSIAASDADAGNSRQLPQGPVSYRDYDGRFDRRSNLPTGTVQGGENAAEADPYAARGLRLGTFDLFPTLEQSIGYTSNANSEENGSASGFSQSAIGLRVQSNWSINRFEAELGATYQRFFDGTSENLPTANANASLRLDIARDYAVTIRGSYNLTTESASSANLATGSTATIVGRPNVHALAASAELAKTEGRLRFSLRGSVNTLSYEDANLSDGTKLLQGDRDNMLASVTARLSYQASTAVSPFVEASVGQRIFDIKTDSNGNQRDSKVYTLRGGLELDFGEKLTGQLALGYATEDFKDANISALSGVTIDGSINWSPVRLTTVTATASTTLSGSSNINDNGSIIYSGNLGITRRVRPQLTLDANISTSLQEYDTTGRRDVTLGVNAGYTYWFNRFVAATGRVSYQTVDSTEVGASYDTGTVLLGLRLQR